MVVFPVHLKHIPRIKSFPQIAINIEMISNHYPANHQPIVGWWSWLKLSGTKTIHRSVTWNMKSCLVNDEILISWRLESPLWHKLTKQGFWMFLIHAHLKIMGNTWTNASGWVRYDEYTYYSLYMACIAINPAQRNRHHLSKVNIQ